MISSSPHVDVVTRGRYARGKSSALDAIFPRACVLCDAPGKQLCDSCRRESTYPLANACPRCAIPLGASVDPRRCGRCLARAPAFDASLAAAAYEAPFDALVRGLKYSARLAYAPLLADLLHERVAAHRFDIDVLIPVPLSRDRMAARGFNQSIEIARPLASRMRTRLDTASVLRIRDTPPQAALPFDARRKNIRGAFAVIDARVAMLEGSTVGVVDDVMTTGSTLDEMAATLKRAGVARVVNLVVARTP